MHLTLEQHRFELHLYVDFLSIDPRSSNQCCSRVKSTAENLRMQRANCSYTWEVGAPNPKLCKGRLYFEKETYLPVTQDFQFSSPASFYRNAVLLQADTCIPFYPPFCKQMEAYTDMELDLAFPNLNFSAHSPHNWYISPGKMSQMLELSNKKCEEPMINVSKALEEKVDTMHEQLGISAERWKLQEGVKWEC